MHRGSTAGHILTHARRIWRTMGQASEGKAAAFRVTFTAITTAIPSLEASPRFAHANHLIYIYGPFE